MAIGFFEFFDAAGVKRRLKCDIDGTGQVTFVTQLDGTNSFSVDWTDANPIELRDGSNVFDIDGAGAGLIRGTVEISNIVSVGFPTPQSIQFSTPQRTLGNTNFFPSRFITPTNNSAVVRNASARLHSFRVENLSTSANRFLIFFNQTTTPSNNQSSNIVDAFNIPPGQVISFGSDYFSQEGINFSSGIAVGFSTLRSQFTTSGTNEMDLTVISALN